MKKKPDDNKPKKNNNNLLNEWLKNNEIIDKDQRTNKINNDENYNPFQDHDFGKIPPKKHQSHTGFYIEDDDLFARWVKKSDIVDKDNDLFVEEIYKYPPDYDKAIKVQDSIDLHRLTIDKAIKELSSFILKSFNSNLTVVKIIHGKGNHTIGKAKLKPAVLRWLNGEGKGYVRFFKPAHPVHGGEGATIVWLK